MAVSLTEDFKTVNELQQDPEAILAQMRNTGRPIIITHDGKPGVVMLPVDAFERLIHTINLARLLAEAQEDIRAGRTQPRDEWFKEFEPANRVVHAGRIRRPSFFRGL